MTSEDQKLLELAAKAAGIPAYWITDGTIQNRPVLVTKCGGRMGTMPYEEEWNPLRDDAKALRLSVKLNIDVLQRTTIPPEVWAQAPMQRTVIEPIDPDRHAATRRAIVRAAAAIGEATR